MLPGCSAWGSRTVPFTFGSGSLIAAWEGGGLGLPLPGSRCRQHVQHWPISFGSCCQTSVSIYAWVEGVLRWKHIMPSGQVGLSSKHERRHPPSLGGLSSLPPVRMEIFGEARANGTRVAR
ncbi:uncharacterized protein BDV17DRAFT_264430 [Aspergillus undulatus]|uniref:uncharacterized protein n=1 Tax=Aspergillus undulatus TaxID=1810928 RepID=UPI003CCD1E7A